MEHDPRPVERFAAQPHTRARGRSAEEAAIAWLAAEGYEIVERNHANAFGEIDLIARDGDTLCFLEIKARLDTRYGRAVAAVSPHKQRRLARVAAVYLVSSEWTGPCRFDVLGLEPGRDGWAFDLVRDAFDAPASLG